MREPDAITGVKRGEWGEPVASANRGGAGAVCGGKTGAANPKIDGRHLGHQPLRIIALFFDKPNELSLKAKG